MFVLRIELITNCNWYKLILSLSIHKNMRKKAYHFMFSIRKVFNTICFFRINTCKEFNHHKLYHMPFLQEGNEFLICLVREATVILNEHT